MNTRMTVLRRTAIAALVVLALAGPLRPGRAEASVSLAISLVAPPALVVVPGTPVAYAPAVPADYFFYGGRYYVLSNGAWFVSPGYNGPWGAVVPAHVPRPLWSVPIRYHRAGPWWMTRHGAYPPAWTPVQNHHWGHRRDGWRHDPDWDRGGRHGDHSRDRH